MSLKRGRWLAAALIYGGLLLGGWFAGNWLETVALIDVLPQNESHVHAMIMLSIAAFVVASAMPFVPGAEIGLALIFVFGAKIAPLVYAAMVTALALAFICGRLVPLTAAARFFGFLGFERMHDLLGRLAGLDSDQCLKVLLSEAPERLVPTLLKHRYLALLVLLNLPGNSIVGGGGGIAFTAGISRLFSFPRYLATMLFAVAPVPLYVVIVSRLG